MITFVFIALMLGVFGKLISLAVRMAWGLTKILFRLVLLPGIIICAFCAGLVYIAIPALIVLAVILLASQKSR